MVIKLQCDLFSIGEFKATKNGKEVNEHPFLDLIKHPNFYQSQRQWLWDYMFWLMLGNAKLYSDSRILQNKPSLVWLNPSKIDYDRELALELEKIITSKKKYEDVMKRSVKYKYSDGTSKYIKLKEILHFFDTTNGTGDWFNGNSVLDAIGQIVGNSELANEAKNVNLFFAGKYMVGGDKSSDNQYEKPLSKPEKESIEGIVNSTKKVIAVKNQINIKRFVENLEKLKLDDSFFSDYYAIGKIYGIPKDVLEAYVDGGATYENQEKAKGSHVSYTLTPKGSDLTDSLKTYFNLDIDISLTWEHLPFMEVFSKQKQERLKLEAETFKTLIEAGATPESVSAMFGYDLKFKTNG
jgi:hypothetical protein